MKNYEHITSALSAARISTLDEFISHGANADPLIWKALLEANGTEPAPLPEHPVSLPPIIHRHPKVPLILNGELVTDPVQITSYNGQPLFYTPVRSCSGIALTVYTSRERMIKETPGIEADLQAVLAQSASETFARIPRTTCRNRPASSRISMKVVT